jgi:eukaryotic-like serine/threonine-protein kinase
VTGVRDPFGIVGTMQSRVFRVEAAVAEGGFGVVYRAYHEAFRSYVALKCLKVPDVLSDEQKLGLLEKFRTEAELLFRLSASLPEIVRPLQFGVLELEDGSPGTPTLGAGAVVPYLAMEWLEGQTLGAFVAGRVAQSKPPLTLSRAVELLTPVAKALARAHDFRGTNGGAVTIIHRDMKPENVFLANIDGEQRPKILDFGIARIRADASAMLGRATGADPLHAFSPAYAAPEQWNPSVYGATGPWTDVYALALVLTEVLIGRPPIDGDFTVMMGSALNKDWRPTPRARGANVTDETERVFERALAVDPRLRTASVEAFWTQLELSCGRGPSITRRHEPILSDLPSTPPPPELDLEADIPMQPSSSSGAVLPAPASRRWDQLETPTRDPNFEAPAASVREPGFALELGGAPKSIARPRPNQLGPGVWQPQSLAPARSLWERFSTPLWFVVAAVAVGLADLYMVRTTGHKLPLGPISTTWIAGPLATIGIGLGIVRLIQD